jgi:hypothetical protein
VRLDPTVKAEAVGLGRQLSTVARSGLLLPGSLTQRLTRCGRQGCRCGGDPPQLHGPYWSWTRKVNNKTVTRYLSPEQAADYQDYFDNARTLRSLVAELESLSLAAVEDDPRWNR